jgi:hypothetical protein
MAGHGLPRAESFALRRNARDATCPVAFLGNTCA